MSDPRNKYPAPPFPKQMQEFPGLEMQLKPPSDYGRDTYKGTGKLEGKIAVITGGDSGIGRAIAYAYACEGADVAISYLPQEEPDVQVVKEAVESLGRRILLIPGDIRPEPQCRQIIKRTTEAFGKIDILVNNAAFQKTVLKIDDVTQDVIEQTYETNIYAPIYLVKAVWKTLEPGSSIINISSVQAYSPSPDIFIYASTKAALVSITKSLAQMGAKKGIRVNAVAPGPVWSPLNTLGPPDPHAEKFGSKSWFGRPGQPVEVASVTVFLASEDASFVTGHVYGVTGGSEMGI